MTSLHLLLLLPDVLQDSGLAYLTPLQESLAVLLKGKGPSMSPSVRFHRSSLAQVATFQGIPFRILLLLQRAVSESVSSLQWTLTFPSIQLVESISKQIPICPPARILSVRQFSLKLSLTFRILSRGIPMTSTNRCYHLALRVASLLVTKQTQILNLRYHLALRVASLLVPNPTTINNDKGAQKTKSSLSPSLRKETFRLEGESLTSLQSTNSFVITLTNFKLVC